MLSSYESNDTAIPYLLDQLPTGQALQVILITEKASESI